MQYSTRYPKCAFTNTTSLHLRPGCLGPFSQKAESFFLFLSGPLWKNPCCPGPLIYKAPSGRTGGGDSSEDGATEASVTGISGDNSLRVVTVSYEPSTCVPMALRVSNSHLTNSVCKSPSMVVYTKNTACWEGREDILDVLRKRGWPILLRNHVSGGDQGRAVWGPHLHHGKPRLEITL